MVRLWCGLILPALGEALCKPVRVFFRFLARVSVTVRCSEAALIALAARDIARHARARAGKPFPRAGNFLPAAGAFVILHGVGSSSNSGLSWMFPMTSTPWNPSGIRSASSASSSSEYIPLASTPQNIASKNLTTQLFSLYPS